MAAFLLLVQLSNAISYESFEPTGYIDGVVVDATHGNRTLENVTVVLQAGPQGGLAPIAKTTTDIYGKFVFANVPLDPAIIYLPGADRDGVHYPGSRLRLNADNRVAHQRIRTFDAVESPSPLTAARHDIDVVVDTDGLKVTETLLVANASRSTYVGKQAADQSRTTLRLSVPPSLDRVTFKSEFYGRRFRIAEHQPVTDIPWPPGERELKFAYRIPLENAAATMSRALDLPSRNVTIRVRGNKPSEVSCNLRTSKKSSNEIVFASANEELPSAYVVELQVGAQPIPWLQYVRSGSLIALFLLVSATVVVLRRRERPGSAVE